MFPYQEKVNSKYGAPMGRKSDALEEFDGLYNVHLRRVPFVAGCYDQGGAYWGAPNDLYCVWTYNRDGFQIVAYVRANSRAAAKALFPTTTFYR